MGRAAMGQTHAWVRRRPRLSIATGAYPRHFHTMSETPIRDASTIILVRDRLTAPRILMGQRGKKAAFMPNKYVFPGGAVDANDAEISLAGLPDTICQRRLGEASTTLLAAAIRETWEETGLRMGQPGPAAPWSGFSTGGLAPSAQSLRYIFRAITPPGRPRRFDARFFLADAETLADDLDDFSDAEDELSHLHWVPLGDARALNLPFITEVVLAEVSRLVATEGPPESVPFFDNSGSVSKFTRIY